MSKIPTLFECQSCGYSSAKWLGRCPDCGSWNSFVEEKRTLRPKTGPVAGKQGSKAKRLSEVSLERTPRIVTAMEEFNGVLGGGIVPGSLVLLGGEPGIGKSTLLLQIADCLHDQGRRVLYVSGEESASQIKMRAERLGNAQKSADRSSRDGIYILAESSFENILNAIDEAHPTDIIVDSIQTTYSEGLDSAPGSISQVRHVATQLLNLAKSENIPIFLIGHVTKEGNIAGPKSLEHIVDVVLYFEGERHHNYRIVRAVKNRFGAANEIGIFEMTDRGLMSIRNPSKCFISEGETLSPGSAVVCAFEGTRPILVEIQALVIATQYGTARRTSTGIDYNRISVLVAMLEKRLEVPMMGCDIYVNAAGGLEIKEPAADLAVFASILSSFRNRALPSHTVLLGELSLSGEVRAVNQIYPRVREAAAMGFKKCIIPEGNLPLMNPVENIELIPIVTVSQLSDLVFSQ